MQVFKVGLSVWADVSHAKEKEITKCYFVIVLHTKIPFTLSGFLINGNFQCLNRE